MGKLQEVDEQELRIRSSKDKMCSFAEEIEACEDDADRKLLTKWVFDKSIEASKLGRELNALGIDLSDSTIRRHRNSRCQYCNRHLSSRKID